MSMLGHMLSGEIAEGETALQELDEKLTAAEAKLVPFLAKVVPITDEVLTELINLSPTLKAAVTPTEIAEFASGVSALPGLLSELHAAITGAEAKLKAI